MPTKISEKVRNVWNRKWLRISSYLGASILALIIILYVFAWRSPADFPLGIIYTVDEGAGLNHTALTLHDQEIIRSEFWFKSFLVLFGGPKGLMAGDYVLPRKQNLIGLAFRLSHGDYELEPVRITVHEGLNVFEIAELLSTKLVKIDKEDFIKKAEESEGYLFPDTYYFLPNSNTRTVLEAMTKNFDGKITELTDLVTGFGKPISDVIKMASIVEKEASNYDARQMVAGILWQRLELGMPLQVDVSFKYINGKVTESLSLEDLKIDSPYNSYLYKGLPPTPISNPGLDAIRATLTPTESDYLYFLSDDDGNMHYAKSYTTHLKNKEIYLN